MTIDTTEYEQDVAQQVQEEKRVKDLEHELKEELEKRKPEYDHIGSLIDQINMRIDRTAPDIDQAEVSLIHVVLVERLQNNKH